MNNLTDVFEELPKLEPTAVPRSGYLPQLAQLLRLHGSVRCELRGEILLPLRALDAEDFAGTYPLGNCLVLCCGGSRRVIRVIIQGEK